MNVNQKKVLLVMQSEIYCVGLTYALKADYNILSLPFAGSQNSLRTPQRPCIHRDTADVAIIGFDLDSAQSSLDTAADLQAMGMPIIPMLFHANRWLFDEIMNLNPNALLHYASASSSIKSAIEQVFKGSCYCDDQLIEFVISYAVESKASIIDKLAIYNKDLFAFIPQGLFDKDAISNPYSSNQAVELLTHSIYRKNSKRDRIEVIKLMYRNKITLS
jgi:DNA-binding NarL/FixJ family response regulator